MTNFIISIAAGLSIIIGGAISVNNPETIQYDKVIVVSGSGGIIPPTVP
jgi:hypothetical protein